MFAALLRGQKIKKKGIGTAFSRLGRDKVCRRDDLWLWFAQHSLGVEAPHVEKVSAPSRCGHSVGVQFMEPRRHGSFPHRTSLHVVERKGHCRARCMFVDADVRAGSGTKSVV